MSDENGDRVIEDSGRFDRDIEDSGRFDCGIASSGSIRPRMFSEVYLSVVYSGCERCIDVSCYFSICFLLVVM